MRGDIPGEGSRYLASARFIMGNLKLVYTYFEADSTFRLV